MTDNRIRFLSIPALLAILVLSGSVEAIIIRHDKGYDDYRVQEVDFPAVFFLERQGNRRICAATLIDLHWAITAAHCIDQTALGETRDSGKPFSVRIAGQERNITSVMVHPNYLPDAADEVDLALLHFREPVAFPVPVSLNRARDEAGMIVDLVGWGYFGLGTTGRQYSDGAIRRARNRVESAQQRLLIRFDDPRREPDSVLDLEGMPGLGDSGGPALFAGADGWVLLGVAVGEVNTPDFSEETQGRYGSQAVYERISGHLEWIGQTMADNQGIAAE